MCKKLYIPEKKLPWKLDTILQKVVFYEKHSDTEEYALVRASKQEIQ